MRQSPPSPGVAVDLTTCDREPIHLLGAIQSFGFLLSVNADWIVVRASENTHSAYLALILISLSVSRPSVASTQMFCTISAAGFNWPLLRAWLSVCSGSD